MNLFRCDECGQLVHFENTSCENCDAKLGFDWGSLDVVTLTTEATSSQYRECENASHGVCNSVLIGETDGPLCFACRFTRTVPDLSVDDHLEHWREMEFAKRRLLYSLVRLHLPLTPKSEDSEGGLAFDFLSDPADPEQPKVMTGHAEGVITLNIAEADDAHRECTREEMGEPYRTLLGHMRHEVGHYFWDLLVRDAPALARVREQFGDDTQDYADSLKRHYAQGSPADWRERYVSEYASSHPWEDWAETWAHYLHMVGTLETAHVFGLRVAPKEDADGSLTSSVNVDPYTAEFDEWFGVWVPLTVAVNSLNRSMGQPDLYPFVTPPAVVEKLRTVHDIIRGNDPTNAPGA